jgi:predicted transcriptional regulator
MIFLFETVAPIGIPPPMALLKHTISGLILKFSIAKKFNVTHVAVKKHLDLLLEEGYVKQINPKSKPVYLELTKKGKDVLNEFAK